MLNINKLRNPTTGSAKVSVRLEFFGKLHFVFSKNLSPQIFLFLFQSNGLLILKADVLVVFTSQKLTSNFLNFDKNSPNLSNYIKLSKKLHININL